MSGQLHVHGPEDARCVVCGALAVGPCARCHDPLCGDCCVISEGGSKVFAICPRCDSRGGRSLTGNWWTVIGWLAGPIALLALAVLLLGLLQHCLG